MSKFEILHITNVLAIWFYAIFLIKILGKSEHGLFKSVLRAIFYKDKFGLDWMCERKYIFACYIQIPALIGLGLGLLSQLQDGYPKIRQEWTMTLSIIIFLATSIGTYYMHNQVQKYENKNK